MKSSMLGIFCIGWVQRRCTSERGNVASRMPDERRGWEKISRLCGSVYSRQAASTNLTGNLERRPTCCRPSFCRHFQIDQKTASKRRYGSTKLQSQIPCYKYTHYGGVPIQRFCKLDAFLVCYTYVVFVSAFGRICGERLFLDTVKLWMHRIHVR